MFELSYCSHGYYWADWRGAHWQSGRAARRRERHNVILSNSRGPDTLTELVAELGPRARGEHARAARAGDIVVVTSRSRIIGPCPLRPWRARS